MGFKDSVITFGAVPDSLSVQTEAFQKTLDACRDAGGGEVIIPSGKYIIGSIRLYSNTVLHLMNDAVLIGSADVSDYTDFGEKTTLGYVYNAENINLWHLPPYYVHALISAVNAENISIIGEKNSGFNGSNVVDPNGEEEFRGPMGIRLCKCKNIKLSDYKFIDSSNWAHQIDSCSNIDISRLKIYAGHDGVDVHHCSNIYIHDCDMQSGDDCIAGYDSYNLHVDNCRFNTACNSLRIGCVNMLVENCTFYGPAANPHRVSGRHNTLFAFEYYSIGTDTVRDNSRNWFIKNCTFDNIDGLIHYEFGDKIHLQVSTPLEDVTFQNVIVKNLHSISTFKGSCDTPAKLKFIDSELGLAGDYRNKAYFDTSEFSEISLIHSTNNSENVPLTM